MTSLREVVEREVSGWPGVELRVRGHEIGHLHGRRLADLPFPVRMRKELVAEGKAEPQYALPQTGWASHYPPGPEDAPAVAELFRLNYEHLVQKGKKKAERVAPEVTTGEEVR
jgi:hypothetical protein